MSTTAASQTTAAITQHWRNQVADLTAPTHPAADAALVKQRRMLTKLAALWEANPTLTLGDVLLTAVSAYAARTSDLTCHTQDSEVEAALDGALAAAGVAVSGGWKS